MPIWLKFFPVLFLCVLIPVYWRHYGPGNFLWFSDIALFLAVAAIWLQNPLLASMAALSVLLLELAWNVDFFVRLITGFRGMGLADYMWESHRPLYLRAISLFHILLPVLLIYLVHRLGYDDRALIAQTILAWVVVPLTYLLTDPAQNINWVHGLGKKPQQWMPPLAYLGLLMLAFPLCVYLPTHLLLRHLFPMHSPLK